jgi:PEGA domain
MFVANPTVMPARSVDVRWKLRLADPLVLAAGILILVAPVARAQTYPTAYPPQLGGYTYIGPESHLRLVITPREAMVYVDGYLAGTVDDFDGTFQRLHVAPGDHELVIYLQGYRTIKQHLYLGPDATRKITEKMEKLPAGEMAEPPPQPLPPVEQEPSDRDRDRSRPYPRESRPMPPPPPETSAPSIPDSVRGGSLILRVQPPAAEVRIDGERWVGPSSGDDRLVVQVSEGHHRIEVTKDGYVAFTTEVDVQRGESLPLNVSLARDR